MNNVARWFWRMLSAFFKPDVIVSTDPLVPNARAIAHAIGQVTHLCAQEERRVCLLVSRVPGYRVRIGLNATKRRCYVDIVSAADSATVRHAEASLCALSPGKSPALFEISGTGDNLRLVFYVSGSAVSWLVR